VEDIINLAREIGFAIQNNSDYIEFKIKEQNMNCNKDLQKTLEEFNLKKAQINLEMSKAEANSEKIDQLNKEVGELYSTIISSRDMKEYNKAKEKFDKLLQKISLIINKSAEGQDPYSISVQEYEGCQGSCTTCNGCR